MRMERKAQQQSKSKINRSNRGGNEKGRNTLRKNGEECFLWKEEDEDEEELRKKEQWREEQRM